MFIRIVAGMFVVVLLFLGVAALYAFLFAGDGPAPAPEKKVARVWNGREEQTYNASWTRSCGANCVEETQLVSISFAGLNSLSSSLTARFVVIPPPGRSNPAWINNKNFVVRSRANRFWPVIVRKSRQANKYIVDVGINNLPSKLLGPGPGSAAQDNMELLVDMPGQAIAIGLQAPAPSVAGSQLGQTGAGRPWVGRKPNKNDKRLSLAVDR